ncbi:unnamed protein product, partial [Mesorhabditis spiculigera]
MFLGWRIYAIRRDSVGGVNADSDHPDVCKYARDNDSVIFREYEKIGYKTMYSEDYGSRDRIFLELQRVQGSGGEPSLSNCFEWHTAQLDYFGKFLRAYNGTPKFVINWSTAPCHDDPNLLYHADEDFYNFLEKHEKRLQNAFIFFMGDHGPRYGVVARAEMGKREINNPLLHISVPHWLRNNTQLTKNMEENSQRMILQYDIYETLKDILRGAWRWQKDELA